MRISDWSSDVCSSDLLAGTALVVPPVFAIQTDEDARLDAFFEAVFQRSLDRSPTRQSSLGIRRDQDKWDDVGEARELEGHRLLEQDATALKGFDEIGRASCRERV